MLPIRKTQFGDRQDDPAYRGSAIFVFVAARADFAEVVVAAEIDVVAAKIRISLLGLLLLDRFRERDRLLRLEHRLGDPLVAALDADDRIVLAEIVEPLTP